MSRTQLYRHFDKDGTLLYVGISLSAVARLSQHKASSWFDQIAMITVETHPTLEVALERERAAIRIEKPIYNKMHNYASVDDVVDLIEEVNRYFTSGQYPHVISALSQGAPAVYFSWPGSRPVKLYGAVGTVEFHNNYMRVRAQKDPYINRTLDIADADLIDTEDGIFAMKFRSVSI